MSSLTVCSITITMIIENILLTVYTTGGSGRFLNHHWDQTSERVQPLPTNHLICWLATRSFCFLYIFPLFLCFVSVDYLCLFIMNRLSWFDDEYIGENEWFWKRESEGHGNCRLRVIEMECSEHIENGNVSRHRGHQRTEKNFISLNAVRHTLRQRHQSTRWNQHRFCPYYCHWTWWPIPISTASNIIHGLFAIIILCSLSSTLCVCHRIDGYSFHSLSLSVCSCTFPSLCFMFCPFAVAPSHRFSDGIFGENRQRTAREREKCMNEHWVMKYWTSIPLLDGRHTT